MKKWLLFVACFGVVALMNSEGFSGIDVAKLNPVQTIYLAAEENRVLLRTDTGAKGSGENLINALRDLQDTNSGLVFLDTADYLLVAEEQRHLIREMEEVLRPSCRICLVVGQVDMVSVGEFLQIHQPVVTMKEYLAGWQDLETLMAGEETRLVS